MALVNAMSVALLSSALKVRFLPVAVTLVTLKDDGYLVDPTTS